MEDGRLKNDLLVIKGRIEVLSSSTKKLETAIFGNGRDGLRTEVVKLRQALKAATWVAGVIGTVMLADFTKRSVTVQPADVQEDLEKFEAKQSAVQAKILTELKEVRESP